jgi:tellurite resistance protein
MRLLHPDPDSAAALIGLRAMKTMAAASGAIGPSQRAVMEAAKKVILRIDADIDSLPPITPAELALGFPSPELRRQFVNGMLVVALADGVPSRATVAKVEEFAEALGVAGPELGNLRQLAEGHMLERLPM